MASRTEPLGEPRPYPLAPRRRRTTGLLPLPREIGPPTGLAFRRRGATGLPALPAPQRQPGQAGEQPEEQDDGPAERHVARHRPIGRQRREEPRRRPAKQFREDPAAERAAPP